LFFYQEVARSGVLQQYFTFQLIGINSIFFLTAIRWFLILKLMDTSDLIMIRELQGETSDDLKSQMRTQRCLQRCCPEWRVISKLWVRSAWKDTIRSQILKNRSIRAMGITVNHSDAHSNLSTRMNSTLKLHAQAMASIGVVSSEALAEKAEEKRKKEASQSRRRRSSIFGLRRNSSTKQLHPRGIKVRSKSMSELIRQKKRKSNHLAAVAIKEAGRSIEIKPTQDETAKVNDIANERSKARVERETAHAGPEVEQKNTARRPSRVRRRPRSTSNRSAAKSIRDVSTGKTQVDKDSAPPSPSLPSDAFPAKMDNTMPAKLNAKKQEDKMAGRGAPSGRTRRRSSMSVKQGARSELMQLLSREVTVD